MIERLLDRNSISGINTGHELVPFTCGICPNQIPALIRGGNWGQTEQFHQRCKREQRTRIITKTLNAPKMKLCK